MFRFSKTNNQFSSTRTVLDGQRPRRSPAREPCHSVRRLGRLQSHRPLQNRPHLASRSLPRSPPSSSTALGLRARDPVGAQGATEQPPRQGQCRTVPWSGPDHRRGPNDTC
ncbi:hypothetical protein VULLAG_LOCUS19590 [Vulpes lagopus]